MCKICFQECLLELLEINMELSEVLYLIGQWSGFLALVSLAFLIFSGDTARFTDRFFGLDRIIKFQRKFSFLSFAFLFLHPIFFILSGQSFANYFIPAFYALPLAFGTLAFYVFIAVMFFSYFYKRISYKAWQYIHVLTYLLFFAALYHAFFWGSHSDKLFFIISYIILIVAVFVGAVYRTLYKIKEKRLGAAEVIYVKWENDDVFTVAIKTKQVLKFRAGQFCFLRLDGRKLYARHPFTISSAPQDDELLFTVKNTGRFTSALSGLKAGDKINIDGPFGRFVEKVGRNEMVFIAGGVGITPFRSLIRDLLKKNMSAKISLIYCAKKEKDLVFRNEFEALKSDRFNSTYVLSHEEKDCPGTCRGFLSSEIIKASLNGVKAPLFYICGPVQMKKAAKEIIKSLGLPKDDIIVEDFFW